MRCRMPIGTSLSYIPPSVIDKLAQQPSWLRRHPGWPECLWRIEIRTVGEISGSQPCDVACDEDRALPPRDETEEDDLFDDLKEKRDHVAILSNKEFVDDIFAGNGAALGFDAFNITRCKHRGAVAHRGALVRCGNNIFQLWDGPNSPQRASVLGRIGCITIICKQIEAILSINQEIPREHVTIGELARFICATDVERIRPTAKLLDRVNQGYLVTDRSLVTVCRRLRLVVDDIAFCHPTVFAGKAVDRYSEYIETSGMVPRQGPATPWIGKEFELYKWITNERSLPKIDVKHFRGAGEQVDASIKFAVDGCRQHRTHKAQGQLERLSRELVNAGLSAWFSCIQGSGDGDPEGRGRLIVVLDKAG